jgi:phosphopantetheinyl transferase
MLALAICEGSTTPAIPLDDQFPDSLSARIGRNIEARLRQSDRQRSLNSYRLVYRLLAKAGFVASRLPGIDIDERGKPYLPSIPEIHVSLSHASDWLACAISSMPVGIDIESAPNEGDILADIEELAQFFHPAEKNWLAKRKGRDRTLAFLLLWTRKEAYLKARGQGLSEGMGGASALPCAIGRFGRVRDDARPSPPGWVLSLDSLAPETFLSVCLLAKAPASSFSMEKIGKAI